jgi:hypothetical protein
MKLTLKRNFSGWVEVSEVKFKLKYPTIEQGKKIEQLDFESFVYEFVTEGEETKAKIKNIDSMKLLELKRYCIKVWIEDWEGMTEGENPVKCELINMETDPQKPAQYELESSLWWGLVRDISVTHLLFDTFKKELELTNSDKKK